MTAPDDSAAPDGSVPQAVEVVINRGANLFRTHRTLYVALMVLAWMQIALAANFLLTTPTFKQFNINKNLIGFVFLGLGVAQVTFLNIFRNLKRVRLVTAISAAFMLFWGVGTSQTFFEHKSSLQLFILYVTLAALQFALLVEPSVNPVSHPETPLLESDVVLPPPEDETE